MEDAIESLKYFMSLGYDRSKEILPGVNLTFYDAGHILGSAIIALDIEDKEEKKSVRLVFSGDLGRENKPILRDPAYLKEADILLIESTYGNRLHAETEAIDDKLMNIINKTCRQGGKVIVPCFAVGRTQELVYSIHKLVEAGKISKELPVFVDSPLAIDATGIYRLHPEAYDEETANFLIEHHQQDPFGFDMMRYTRSTSQSKELNTLTEPAVIISASGMAEAGRILHHLKNSVENKKNTILIVGWQAPHTLGRRLVERKEVVNIFGRQYKRNAEVHKINGLSAHADYSELLNWVNKFEKKPSKTYVVHGEEEASLTFAKKLSDIGLKNVSVPEVGQSFVV